MNRDKIRIAVLVLSVATSVFALSSTYHYYSLYQKAVEPASQQTIIDNKAQQDKIVDKAQQDIKDEGEASQKYNNDTLSPAIILNRYITALRTGDNKLLNSLLSNKYIKERTFEAKGYKEFPAQNISYALIMVNDYEQNSIEEANYILQFFIDKESEPVFYYTGEYYFFIKLIYEDNMWKIDAMATSP